jgi:xylan 1,4-beta-xylosidase
MAGPTWSHAGQLRGGFVPLRFVAVFVVAAGLWQGTASAPVGRASIHVDATRSLGPMTPFWRFFGYDEPNYTYLNDGRKLLSELSALSPVPVYIRTHNLLTSGDGTPSLKWGSTNAYTASVDGRVQYDWTIIDRIFDTYLERKMKPLVEVGFMPEALSTHPQPYRHTFPNGSIFTGWSYPPDDYAKWGELVFQWARHAVAKYGRAEVESWYWEVWNEPDIGYWRGTSEEYQRLYDFAAAGVKRALPTARVGGPHVTSPTSTRSQEFLRGFLDHCLRGTNFATGAIGSPLDYVGFHAKGAPRLVDGHVRMGLANQLRAISNGFGIVASYPELQKTPIIIGESDPEGCAACSMRTNPENAYRNGALYASYTAEQLSRTYELADLHHVNLAGSVTWAFEFEQQPFFEGFRDLATNGVDKPVLNVFRMLGQMGDSRVATDSSAGLSLASVRDRGVGGEPDVNALGSRSSRAIAVLVWNYHDDDLPAQASEIELTINGVPVDRPIVEHYRIDADHSNAYEAWKKMGAPARPSTDQYHALERAGQLERLEPPRVLEARGASVTVMFGLPRQAVSLLKITW